MKRNKEPLSPDFPAYALIKGFQTVTGLTSKLFLLVGVVMLLVGGKKVYDAHQTNSWLPVSGIITVSSMSVDTSSSGFDDDDYSPSYTPDIAYEYSVAGLTYSNSGIILGGNVGSSSPSRASSLINKYPLDSQVTVYYNPSDPYQSVLEKGVHLETWFLAGFGLGLLVFHILWGGTFGKLFGIFRLGGVQEFSVPASQEDAPLHASSRATGAQVPRLIGKWKILKQLPSQVELAKIVSKAWGVPHDDSALYTGGGKTVIVITAKDIAFVSNGIGSFLNQPPIPYTVKDDKLVLGQARKNFLTAKLAEFSPSFYHYHFAGDQLVLKSNPIEGLDNASISYFLSKM